MEGKWDEVVDIVVAGYGLAGAVATITAHDLGAKVLILEKGAYPGGCSVLAGGATACVRDVNAAIKYLTAIHGDRMQPDLIRSFAEGLAENEQFIEELVQAAGAKLKVAQEAGGGSHSFPGREAFFTARVVEVSDFQGFPWVKIAGSRGSLLLFKVVMDNVETRSIPVQFRTPVKQLIQDASDAVIGVVAESDGKRVQIGVRKAVILATGGFEQSPWLQDQFLQGKPFCSLAPLTNTGDGILMAQKAGAALSHMWYIYGSYGFKFPDHPIGFRHCIEWGNALSSKMPWIVVDKRGKRYMNEYPARAIQIIAYRPMQAYDPDLPGYPRIPSYMVFDDKARKMGPIARPKAFIEHAYDWSADNLKEVERGWILSAKSLEELAAKIRAMPDNQDLMDDTTLVSTVKDWNSHIRTGDDPLGRRPTTMVPIESPPFYAVPVWPHITATLGGPVHDAHQGVLDPFGKPIPGLYAVGELGSFFSHIYEHGGNLGECFSSGRIAGQHAAKLEPRA